MPSSNVDGVGPGVRATESSVRHRRNSTNTQSTSDHSDTPAYTEEQLEAVKWY